jgi:hypothetical protein
MARARRLPKGKYGRKFETYTLKDSAHLYRCKVYDGALGVWADAILFWVRSRPGRIAWTKPFAEAERLHQRW